MVTRKEEKNTSSSLPARLQAVPQPDRQREPIPHPLPAQTCRRVQVSRAPTLALRLRPHPGIKVTGEGFLAPPRAQGSDGKVSGRVGASAALAGPRPLAPAWPALVRALPHQAWAWGPWTVPTWCLLTSCGHDSGSRSQSSKGRGETRQGVGRKISPTRTPAHRGPPWGGGSQRGDAARRTPGCPGSRREPPPSGRGNADS